MKEWKASHRLVDKNGLEIGETLMKEGSKYFTYEAWWFGDGKPETDETLHEMGWFAVSSFREED